jgi:propanol-preferring alcohol dehydrogenase
MPIIPGHQVVGIVERCGARASRFKPGDRVGIAWLRSTCGQCRYCKSGRENLCLNARFTGYHEHGGYAEYATVRDDFAYALPASATNDELAVQLSPLLCAGILGYRAVHRANVRPHSCVGLYGFGSSAHLCIQIVKHWHCAVYVMTRDLRHQELARQLGADWVGGTHDRPPALLDSAILFAPVGTIVPIALEVLDAGGTCAIAGIHLTDIPQLHYQRHLFREKALCSVTANTRADGEQLLALAEEIPLRPQITTFPLDQANEALQMLKDDAISGTGVLVIDQS